MSHCFDVEIVSFFSAPSVYCNNTPTILHSSADELMLSVTWTYANTVGIPVTRVEISYTITQRDTTGLPNVYWSSRLSNVEQKSVNITIPRTNIRAGVYLVNVTASNLNGSSTATCHRLNLGII